MSILLHLADKALDAQYRHLQEISKFLKLKLKSKIYMGD